MYPNLNNQRLQRISDCLNAGFNNHRLTAWYEIGP